MIRETKPLECCQGLDREGLPWQVDGNMKRLLELQEQKAPGSASQVVVQPGGGARLGVDPPPENACQVVFHRVGVFSAFRVLH